MGLPPLEILIDLIFPARCVSCGSFGSFLCQKCQSEITFFPYQVCPYCQGKSFSGLTHPHCQNDFGLDGMYVLGHYVGSLRKLIKKVKYQKVWQSIIEISPIIFKNYHQQFNFNFLVPVPLSPRRMAERGFNQAEILAKELQKNFGPPVFVANILKRTRNTKPQFELTYEDRKTNVRNAFSLLPNVIREKITNQSFCLIDDVVTTGSTIFECAKVLKKFGAKKVFSIAIARGG